MKESNGVENLTLIFSLPSLDQIRAQFPQMLLESARAAIGRPIFLNRSCRLSSTSLEIVTISQNHELKQRERLFPNSNSKYVFSLAHLISYGQLPNKYSAA